MRAFCYTGTSLMLSCHISEADCWQESFGFTLVPPCPVSDFYAAIMKKSVAASGDAERASATCLLIFAAKDACSKVDQVEEDEWPSLSIHYLTLSELC